jgi:peptide/nickel transport system substrate-binding protein
MIAIARPLHSSAKAAAMTLRTSITAAAMALATLVAAAPASVAQDLPQLRVAFPEDADVMDPTTGRAYVQRVALLNMCEGLFDTDAKLQIVPRLALSYEWPDPQTLVVKLRPGVSFNDGTPVDAAAVKYSIERHQTYPGSARRGDLASLVAVEIVDPLTVRFRLKGPDVVFLSQLAVRAGVLVSPTAAEAAGKDFGLRPVCAGPYRFLERVAQDRIVIERVPGYWDAANYHFSRVTFRPIADSTVRLANLRAGAIDINMNVPPTLAEEVRKDTRLKLYTFDGLGYAGLTVNMGRNNTKPGPFGTDKRVRQAFDLALDRKAIVDVVFNGVHAPNAYPVPPTSPFFDPAMPQPKRDVARARALLAEAGVKLPFVVQLTVINNAEAVQVAEVMQSMVAEAGFELKLNTMEFVSTLNAADKGDYTGWTVGWTGRPDVDGNLRDLLYTGAGTNYVGYSNPTFDTLLDQARSTGDMAARMATYRKIYALLRDDLPIIYLYNARWNFGMSARVEGFEPVADGMLRLNGVKFAR